MEELNEKRDNKQDIILYLEEKMLAMGITEKDVRRVQKSRVTKTLGIISFIAIISTMFLTMLMEESFDVDAIVRLFLGMSAFLILIFALAGKLAIKMAQNTHAGVFL